jgi:hypothetical protein
MTDYLILSANEWEAKAAEEKEQNRLHLEQVRRARCPRYRADPIRGET